MLKVDFKTFKTGIEVLFPDERRGENIGYVYASVSVAMTERIM